MHPYKVIERTQSAPTLGKEKGVQCLRSLEELRSLRELYQLVKEPLSMSWKEAHLHPTRPLKRPRPRKNIKSTLLNE